MYMAHLKFLLSQADVEQILIFEWIIQLQQWPISEHYCFIYIPTNLHPTELFCNKFQILFICIYFSMYL